MCFLLEPEDRNNGKKLFLSEVVTPAVEQFVTVDMATGFTCHPHSQTSSAFSIYEHETRVLLNRNRHL